MALAAYARNRLHTRRASAVIAVATVTRGRRQVVAVEQRSGMHARTILLELVCRNLIRSHAHGIGMTPRACRSNLRWINRRLGIAHRPDIVHTVTTRTRGYILVTLRVAHAVDARLVLGKLIHANLWIESAHVIRIRMALGA